MEQAIVPAAFRSVLGHFATGVTIITGVVDGLPAGLAANSFTAVSLDPPFVLVCVARTSTTWPRIRETGVFAVNVLGEDHEELSRRFARPSADRFAEVDWKVGISGAPVITDALAFVECEIEIEHDAGDHTIVVGRVVDLGLLAQGRPLVFWRGGYGRLADD